MLSGMSQPIPDPVNIDFADKLKALGEESAQFHAECERVHQTLAPKHPRQTVDAMAQRWLAGDNDRAWHVGAMLHAAPWIFAHPEESLEALRPAILTCMAQEPTHYIAAKFLGQLMVAHKTPVPDRTLGEMALACRDAPWRRALAQNPGNQPAIRLAVSVCLRDPDTAQRVNAMDVFRLLDAGWLDRDLALSVWRMGSTGEGADKRPGFVTQLAHLSRTAELDLQPLIDWAAQWGAQFDEAITSASPDAAFGWPGPVRTSSVGVAAIHGSHGLLAALIKTGALPNPDVQRLPEGPTRDLQDTLREGVAHAQPIDPDTALRWQGALKLMQGALHGHQARALAQSADAPTPAPKPR